MLTERQLKILIAETLLTELRGGAALGSGLAADLGGDPNNNRNSSTKTFKKDCDGDGTVGEGETHNWRGQRGWSDKVSTNMNKFLSSMGCIVKNSDERSADGDAGLPYINSLYRDEKMQVLALYDGPW